MLLGYYPQYDHSHIYLKTYRQHGLTGDQIAFLAEKAVDRDYAEKRFVAGLHGVDLDKAAKRPKEKVVADSLKTDEPLFGDPRMYEKMTEEEKATATAVMRSRLAGLNLPIKQKMPEK